MTHENRTYTNIDPSNPNLTAAQRDRIEFMKSMYRNTRVQLSEGRVTTIGGRNSNPPVQGAVEIKSPTPLLERRLRKNPGRFRSA